MYRTLCQIFVRLRDRGAFTFKVTEITPEIEAEMIHMEQWAGLRPPTPKPLPPKSAEQQLEEEVFLDFNGDPQSGRAPISADRMRAKCNKSAAYREAFGRLSHSGLLHSRATAMHDMKHVGG